MTASGSITAEGGSLGTGLVRGSIGRQFQNGVDLAASGTYQDSHGVDRLYLPAFDAPETNNGVAVGLDELPSIGYRQVSQAAGIQDATQLLQDLTHFGTGIYARGRGVAVAGADV